MCTTFSAARFCTQIRISSPCSTRLLLFWESFFIVHAARLHDTKGYLLMQLTHKASLALALLAAGSLASIRPAAAQHVYDASADFSITSNPSPLDGGVWSYGAETTLGTAFSLDATPRGNAGDPEQGWAGTVNTVYGTFPYLDKNISGKTNIVTAGGNTQTVLPNQLGLHPGPNGNTACFGYGPNDFHLLFFKRFQCHQFGSDDDGCPCSVGQYFYREWRNQRQWRWEHSLLVI